MERHLQLRHVTQIVCISTDTNWCGVLQSLQALEKISHEHPTACLRAGALMAVLSYLDFFSTGVQVGRCDQCSSFSEFVIEGVG